MFYKDIPTKKCPVCGTRVLEVGMRNHIMGKARTDASTAMNSLLNHARNKPYQFSPGVVLRVHKHLRYFRKNYKNTNNKHLHV